MSNRDLAGFAFAVILLALAACAHQPRECDLETDAGESLCE